ncbi:MAG: hypothetical protein ACOX69_09150 [Coriobacteriales bacterium]
MENYDTGHRAGMPVTAEVVPLPEQHLIVGNAALFLQRRQHGQLEENQASSE